MVSGVHRIPACDRQTDEQTSCDSIVRAMHTRRAVKIYAITLLFVSLVVATESTATYIQYE